MLKILKPEIKKYDKEDFISITFEPDLSRFKMDKLDDDTISLFIKRVYDLAGVSLKSVSVYLNNEKLKILKFFPE